jgi:hypothetical protein
MTSSSHLHSGVSILAIIHYYHSFFFANIYVDVTVKSLEVWTLHRLEIPEKLLMHFFLSVLSVLPH